MLQLKNKIKLLSASVLVATLSTGCGGGGGGGEEKGIIEPPPPPPPLGERCGNSVLDADMSCVALGIRHALLYQPKSQQPEGIAMFLHGKPGHPNKVMGIFDAKGIAERHNLLVLAPEGINPTWGWESVNTATDPNNTDVEFIQELLIQVRAEHQIASDDLYLFGYSAGGFMNYKLACEIPEQITAVVSLAGQYRGEFEACDSSSPVAIHHFHSPGDTEVPMGGNQSRLIQPVPDTIAHWQQQNGCDHEMQTLVQAGVTAKSEGTTTSRYTNCSKSVAFSEMDQVAHETDYLAERLESIYGYVFLSE